MKLNFCPCCGEKLPQAKEPESPTQRLFKDVYTEPVPLTAPKAKTEKKGISEKHKAKLSRLMKARWKNPAFRKKVVQAAKKQGKRS